MLHGDILFYTLSFLPNAQLQQCARVCGGWRVSCDRILGARFRKRRRVMERIRMTYEDDRRLHPVTYPFLLRLVDEWVHERILPNPWWGRPPTKKRGALVDAQDSTGAWNPATIHDWHTEWRFRPSIAPCAAIHRQNGRLGSLRADAITHYHIRFLGWSHKWDEFVTCNRIRGLGTRTYHCPNNYVHASRQWSLCCVNGIWGVRLVHPYAVSSLTDVLPLTDVMAALLIPNRKLTCVEL